MSSPAEESPAQRAARLRRERREAKIKEGGAARLDKITSLSGRTPASLHEETSSPSPSPQPESRPQQPAPPAPAPPAFPTTAPAPTPVQPQTNPPTFPDRSQPEPELDPETLQAQQELFRALLRQPAPSPNPQQRQLPDSAAAPNPAGDLLGLDARDPTLKILNSLMSSSAGGGGSGNPLENINLADLGLGDGKESSTDLLTNLGLPPFLANLIGDAMRQKTDAEKREIMVWKIVHLVFAIVAGMYLLFVLGSSVSVYGRAPPAPATARDPFTVFMTGEVVLSGARALLRSRGKGFGLGLGVQLVRDVIRDGSLMVFLFGMATWWLGDRLV
ncbi:uncharacterized protein BO97DRAFT_439428 [Aspergillus homomorphus CBS 101889]|uniref:GET complex, subunit GET2 n=1 Tax=Aspergillus homomorphus (strain CBS 101889) TaxID=1450537 RepID=A0A395IBH3_ASPHC|nr:hypothetical protein BO97DRAFT_439428 [Aspergillus homomorphus CBS 101889]RAL17547.1 hypothetical protein BO97DRAFT_439428 [Aspergillus homomorphus CBS 101889]